MKFWFLPTVLFICSLSHGHGVVHELLLKAKKYQKVHIDSALPYLEEAERIARHMNNKDTLIPVLYELLQNRRANGNYEVAQKYAYELEKITYNYSDSMHILILAQIGNIMVRSENAKDSKKYYLKAIKEANEVNRIDWGILGYIGMGNTNYHNNELDSAKIWYLKSKAIVKEFDISETAILTGLSMNMANIEAQRENYLEARSHYLEGYKIFKEEKQNSLLALVCYNLGFNYHKDAIYDSSIIYYRENLQLGRDLGSLVEQQYAHEGLAKVYKELDQFDSAYVQLEKYAALKDSLDREKQLEKIAELNESFQHEESQRTIEEKDTEIDVLNNLKNEKDRYFRYAMGTSLITLIFLGLLIWGYFNLKRRNIKIKAQNIEIDQSLQEKELLLKEIHHRVKNNLQMISSLLNLQSYTINNQDAINALQVCKSRVQAIAVVHQKLYGNQEYDVVNIKSYFEDIIAGVSISDSPQKDIEFEIDIKDIQLDLDTSVPLGLILNEMVINGMKHAFSNTAAPKIGISITKSDKNLTLIYQDNGSGFPDDFNYKESDSLGFEIIEALTDQLKGFVTTHNKNGANITLEIPINEA